MLEISEKAAFSLIHVEKLEIAVDYFDTDRIINNKYSGFSWPRLLLALNFDPNGRWFKSKVLKLKGIEF
jgi:hypothetical protein